MTAAAEPVEDSPRSFAPRLRELTRGLITETGSPDPHVVAEAVISRLTPAQCRDALTVCLSDWIRTEMGVAANRHRPAGQPGRTSPDRIRNWYAQQLGTSLFCGGHWKFLRDCTADDLHLAAAERYKKATETHALGDRWTKVALFMEEHDRDTVAQLSQDELKSLMDNS